MQGSRKKRKATDQDLVLPTPENENPELEIAPSNRRVLRSEYRKLIEQANCMYSEL